MKKSTDFLAFIALIALTLGSLLVHATTTTSVNIVRRAGDATKYPVEAGAHVLIGSFAALNSSNNLVNASDASGLRVVGLHIEERDNTSGNAGDLSGTIEKGLFFVNNSASNALTDANIGSACFIEDNVTVSASGGTNSVVAGIVEDVTATGVWVWVGLPFNPAVVPVAVTAQASKTSTQNSTANGSDAGTTQTLANALKTSYNAAQNDISSLYATQASILAALKQHGLIK